MKKTWDAKDVKIIPMRISLEEYSQRLDETAELVYRYFCQLHADQALPPETLNRQKKIDDLIFCQELPIARPARALCRENKRPEMVARLLTMNMPGPRSETLR